MGNNKLELELRLRFHVCLWSCCTQMLNILADVTLTSKPKVAVSFPTTIKQFSSLPGVETLRVPSGTNVWVYFFFQQEGSNVQRLPSLVICPPTLTGHWCYEVEKFVAKEHLNPLHYTGPPGERIR